MIVPDRTWLAQQRFVRLSDVAAFPIWSSGMRVRILRLAGLTIGKARIERDVRIRNPRVVVGTGCVLERAVCIQGIAAVRILDGVRIRAHTTIDTAAEQGAFGTVVIHRPITLGGS